MKNKKGLSGIVTTLIIILLVIAAIAMIWPAVKGLLSGGSDTLTKTSACLQLEFKTTKVLETPADSGIYNVTIQRIGGDNDLVMPLFIFSTSDSGTAKLKSDSNVGFSDFEKKTVTVTTLPVFTNATSVSVIPYMEDKDGAVMECDDQETSKEII